MFFKSNLKLRNFITGLCSIFDGLISVFTLGHFGSSLTFSYVAWSVKRELAKKTLYY